MARPRKSPPKKNSVPATPTDLTETPPKERKPFKKSPGNLCHTTMRAVKLAAETDIPPEQAYQAIMGRPPAPDTLKRMEKQVEKWSLRHPQALKTASRTIRAFAAGEAVGGTIDPVTGEVVGAIKPKDSTVLAAAQRIVDASDPVIRKTESLSVSIDYHPVDLSQFRTRQPLDVVVETAVERET